MKNAHTTSKDFFLYLGTMISLYLMVIGFLILTFQYINVLFPDPTKSIYNTTGINNLIRIGMSIIIVATPVFLYLTHLIHKEIRKNKEKVDISIRKWLILLTLFGTSSILFIDLIIIINKFIGGDLTIHFILKSISIIVIMAVTFYYYLKDLRGEFVDKAKYTKFIGYTVLIIMIASITTGFLVSGSPWEQRAKRLDNERIQDLANIQNSILFYTQGKGALPESLSKISKNLPTDPETKEPYEYKKINENDFEICAHFLKPSPETQRGLELMKPVIPPRGIEETDKLKLKDANDWEHGPGRNCFVRTIE